MITDSLIAFWKLNRSPVDSIQRLGLTVSSGGIQWVDGKVGSAYQSTGHQTLSGTFPQIDPEGGPLSVSCWMKSDSNIGFPVWLTAANEPYWMYVDSAYIGSFHTGRGEYPNTVNNYAARDFHRVLDVNWHHFLAVWNPSGTVTHRIWVDGVEGQENMRSTDHTASWSGPTKVELFVGSTAKPYIVDSVGIWKRALEADDAAILYDDGNGWEPPIPPQSRVVVPMMAMGGGVC